MPAAGLGRPIWSTSQPIGTWSTIALIGAAAGVGVAFIMVDIMQGLLGEELDIIAAALDGLIRCSPDIEAAAIISFDGLAIASASVPAASRNSIRAVPSSTENVPRTKAWRRRLSIWMVAEVY